MTLQITIINNYNNLCFITFFYRKIWEKDVQNNLVQYVEFLLVCFKVLKKERCVELVMDILGIK